MQLNELALFAGSGGGILGAKLLGWRTVCAVETNVFSAQRLMQRQNEGHLAPFPIWDDVCSFDGLPWIGIVDVVSGGFPCQRFSTAHRGRPTAKDLWPEMRRIVRDVEPPNVLAENVSADAIETAANDLEQMGYKTRMVAISAQELGADHVRERYWLRAYTDDQGELRSDIDAEMAVLESFRPSVWETFAGDSRVADGMAHRMERYRATGNGQIPAMVPLAWHLTNPNL